MMTLKLTYKGKEYSMCGDNLDLLIKALKRTLKRLYDDS